MNPPAVIIPGALPMQTVKYVPVPPSTQLAQAYEASVISVAHPLLGSNLVGSTRFTGSFPTQA
jgi:hypothetical protein